MHGVAEKSARMLKDQINRGYLDVRRAEAKQEAVLFRHAIETPCKVWYVLGKLTYLLHPLAAPRSGIKERHQPKRSRCGGVKCATKLRAGNHHRLFALVRVKHVVDPIEKSLLMAGWPTPNQQEKKPVFLRRALTLGVVSQNGGLSPALSPFPI